MCPAVPETIAGFEPASWRKSLERSYTDPARAKTWRGYLVPILFALELPAFRQGIRFRPVALRLFDDLESFTFREAVFASEVADLVWLAGSDPPSVRRTSLALVVCHCFLPEPPRLNSPVARTLRRFDASRREEKAKPCLKP